MRLDRLVGTRWKRAIIAISGSFSGDILLDNDTLLIGVDRGVRHLIERNIIPHLVIGDLDSIDKQTLLQLLNNKKSFFMLSNWDKDYTDGEWAMRIAELLGIDNVILIGIMGGEIDHFMGNLSLFTMYFRRFKSIIGYTGYQTIELIEGSKCYHLPQGMTISFVPYDDSVQLTLKGVYWEVEDRTFYRDNLPPISNIVISENVSISAKGKVWVIIGREDKPYLLK